ncbi:MAG: ABC transporter permease [Verrucomicrobiales bacterium]|nr:ABC transporter permease [Verrucomicrobiales bacterium]
MSRPGSSPPGNWAIGRLLWSRLIWRHWKKEFRLTLVLILILALGVAVFLSVRLANKAAVSGFGMFTESIAGESDAILRPRSGILEEGVLRELRDLTGSHPIGIFPVLEATGVVGSDEKQGLLRLVGADLVALQNAGNYAEGGAQSFGGGARGGENSVLGKPDRGFVGTSFAKRFGVEVDDVLAIIVNDRSVDLTIAGVLPEDPNRAAVPDNLVLLDLPGLQTLSGHPQSVTRVEFRVPPGPKSEEVKNEALARVWDYAAANQFLLETPEDRKSSVTQMSAAFRLNLTILSGLALLVGMYLILQAMEASVVKRRSEIAILRSLGVTPGQIRSAWLLEAIILGLVGAVVGILLGRLLAIGMVGAIAQTVNTIYYQTTTTAVVLERSEILFCLFFGLAASVVAAMIPAREASMTPPAQTMRQGTQGGGLALLRNRPLGWFLLAVGLGLAFLQPVTMSSGTTVPIGGYLSAMVLVFSASILIGSLFRPMAALLARLKGNVMWSYAASQLKRPEGRHRLTAAGLAVAIGMSAAMGILVASFETTLTSWIHQLLKADIYIAAAGANSVANENTVSEETWQRIAEMPGVAGMDKLRRYTISSRGGDFFLGGADYNDDPERYLQLIWVDPPKDKGPHALEEMTGDRYPGWISQSMARRFDIELGSPIALPTPAGIQPITVAGVFAEYGNETGTLIVSRQHTSRWFSDTSISNIALYAENGTDHEQLIERIHSEFPFLNARTNAKLRKESIRIFHQTFAVTYALEAIAVIIAVSGLGLALAGLLLERRNELTTLKSLGATRREIARSTMWEGSGLAMVGYVGGILLSFLLGWVLIYVINPQSFGWTLVYRVPWASFLLLGLLTVGAAAIVAWVVGFRNAELKSDRQE